MACFAGSVPSMGGVNYTVPVPVLDNNLVYQNTKASFSNVNKSDVILTGADAGSIIGVSKTCTVSLKDPNKQKWSDNTTEDKTYNYTVVKYGDFGACTDAELVKFVADADAGLIDLYEDMGWRVGDKRQITISAIAASGTYDGITWSVGEAQLQQTITLVLLHRGLYDLVTPVLNKQGNHRTKCSFIVGTLGLLSSQGYMNNAHSNVGSWGQCDRRKWCNGGFRQAIPNTIRPIFKKFKTITAETSTGTTLQTVEDYFSLAASKELNGANTDTTQCNATEANALTQFEFYETVSNLNKGSYGYNTRSPHKFNTTEAYCTQGWYNNAPSQGYSGTWVARGISPIGVI